jgi:lysophospholipase L1-like esterase
MSVVDLKLHLPIFQYVQRWLRTSRNWFVKKDSADFQGIYVKIVLLMALPIMPTACVSGGNSPFNTQDPHSKATPSFNQYIIVGDSIMDMSSDELTTTASLILLEENVSVVNISMAGQTMAGIDGKGGAERDHVSGTINYLTLHGENSVVVPRTTAVIVQLGHNDWFHSTSEDNFFHSYIQFLESISRPNDSVSVFCIVPVPATWDYNSVKNSNDMSYEAFRDIVRNVAGTGLCNLVETSDWFTEEDVHDPGIMPDGVHLVAGGHRRFKDNLMYELRNY